MPTTWTLTTDESGNFDDQGARRLVLGGLLWHVESSVVNDRLAKDLRGHCAQHGVPFPIHAYDVRTRRRDDGEAFLRDARTIVGRLLSELGGWVVLLVHDNVRSEPWDFSLHARLLGDVTTLAGHLAGAHKVDFLSCVPASRRTGNLTDEQVERARHAGFPITEVVSEDTKERFVRGVSGTEVREALFALRREAKGELPAWPAAGDIDVESAARWSSHAGLAAADLICNEVLRALGRLDLTKLALGDVETRLGEDFAGRTLILERGSLATLLQIQRSLRETSPDLWGAARSVAALRAGATAGGVLERGTARTAELLWTAALRQLGSVPSGVLLRLARALAARCEADLAAKTGAYEGCWLALDAGWVGASPLAAAVRGATTDRELAARLWKLSVECANHRGDHKGATSAFEAFERVLDAGRSLRLLAEALEAQNHHLVTLQNQLPASPLEMPDILERLEQRTKKLRALADETADLVAMSDAAAPTRSMAVVPARTEEGIARSLHLDGFLWASPDRERGRAIGTIGRSYAFLGRLDEALSNVLEARRYFADSPLDLAFNATVLARALAEKGRLGGEVPAEAVRGALELVGVSLADSPREWAKSVRTAPWRRFGLDALLRVALWLPQTLDRDRLEKLLRSLAKDAELLGALFDGELRSHPSELLGRHAGELLLTRDPDRARAWLAQSVALSGEATDGTIRAFGRFTERLRDGQGPTDDPPGSVLNPTFEYR